MDDRYLAGRLALMAAALFFFFAALCFGVAVTEGNIWPAITGLTSTSALAVFARIAYEEYQD